MRVCDQYAAKTGHMKTVLAIPTTAGEITSLEQRVRRRTAAPWDSLPKHHFVARCSYPATGVSPTTVCPNGDAIELSRPQQKLVDEEGRATDDLGLATDLGNPCS